MSATTLQQLLDDDGSLAEAVETVIDRSDAGAQPINWTDVSDELSTGQWGRLVEHGIVEESGDGFVPADVEALRATLDDDGTDGVGVSDDDDDGWTIYDKAAGLATVALFLGYSNQGIQSTVAHVDGILLAPLDAVLPFYLVILVLAVVTGLYSAVLQSALLDSEKMAEYQQRMQAIQDKREAAKERGDDDALDEIQEEQMEAMGDNLGIFALQFRPMVWIMLVTIPVFLWMRWKLGGHVDPSELRVIFPLVGQVGLKSGSIGPMPAWIGWYFLCSMGFGQIIRKALNIQSAPSE